ncbi:MAG: uroporphyrinogen decarboxylase, partial [Chloroflexota bacterium]|nr:uroporphyrinogen decarboxylase [Chloroflexota bacterium]
RACRLEPVDRTPIWFMRQAGRALPEYRRIRQDHDLLAITHQPELCAEVTLQPVRRLGVDAAILFADIMTPLIGVGLDVQLVDNTGPVVAEPFRSLSDFDRLRPLEPEQDVSFILETIRLLRAELPPGVPLIGFAGAPFTLASYLVEGKSSRTFALTKAFMYGQPELWRQLMERLAELVTVYLRAQIEAGAVVVQLFDSWVGCLALDDYRRYVLPHTRRIFQGLAGTGVPTIHFGADTGALLEALAEAGGSTIGVDWRVPLDVAWARIGYDRGIQGNLDPSLLLGPWEVVRQAAGLILERAGGRPGHIFNLGHGIDPATPVGNLEKLVRFVHGELV